MKGRKQAAKKKGAKKKAAKKKAAKKKGAKKKTKSKRARHLSISIKASVASVQSRHLKKSRSDQVVWKSKDDDYTVTFLDGWPFVQSADSGTRIITVSALGSSRSFTVKRTASKRGYEYQIQPTRAQERRPNPIVWVDE